MVERAGKAMQHSRLVLISPPHSCRQEFCRLPRSAGTPLDHQTTRLPSCFVVKASLLAMVEAICSTHSAVRMWYVACGMVPGTASGVGKPCSEGAEEAACQRADGHLCFSAAVFLSWNCRMASARAMSSSSPLRLSTSTSCLPRLALAAQHTLHESLWSDNVLSVCVMDALQAATGSTGKTLTDGPPTGRGNRIKV